MDLEHLDLSTLSKEELERVTMILNLKKMDEESKRAQQRLDAEIESWRKEREASEARRLLEQERWEKEREERQARMAQERERSQAEMEKWKAEVQKISRETYWYPLAVSTGFLLAAAGLGATLMKFLLSP